MKKIFTLFAITALVLCSCTEDDSFYPQTVNPGDKIAFGGTLDMKNAGKQTRTVYGDRLEGYTEIKWYQGDQVRIYCTKGVDETSNPVTKCDYTVLDPINSTDNQEDATNNIKNDKYEPTHYTRLGVVEGETEMCWADNATHTFYGVYPASGQLNAAGKADAESEVAAGYLELSEGKLKGYLPNKQTPLGSVKYTSEDIKDSEGNKLYTHYTMQPSMRYAYMVAKTPTTPVESVPLTFHPVVTAVEITLLNNTKNTVDGVESEAEVKNITMVSITAEKAVCGEFETTIAGTADGNKNKLVSTGDAYKTVAIPVDDLTLKFGDKLTFTAFIILDESTSNVDLSTIKVNILAGVNSKTATLAANDNTAGGIIVQAKRKNFLNNIPLNLGTVSYTVTPDNWVQYLDEGTDTAPAKIGALSIPGAGGAASKSIYDAKDLVSAQQSLSIADLWAQGIRCFEFGVDRPSSFSSLGGVTVRCNLVATDKTLDQAVGEVHECLKTHPEEFAVVIVTYQEELSSSWDRNAGGDAGYVVGFGGRFHNWWNNFTLAEGLSKGELTADLSVSDARGKMFMIVRASSVGLDGGWYTGIADAYMSSGSLLNSGRQNIYDSTKGPYVAALGWGDHADNWYMRGYGTYYTESKSGITLPTTGCTDRNYVYGTTAESVSGDNAPKFVEPTNSFVYKLVRKASVNWNSATETAYIQDWRRVMPTAALQAQYGITGLPAQGTASDRNTYYYNWAPSSDQKWNDVTTALDEAMNRTSGNYDLYINNLCGYFIDGTIQQSYMPRATFQRINEQTGFLSKTDYRLDDKYRNVIDDELDGDGAPSAGWLGTAWGPYSITGGYKGNIGDYAHWINNLFYTHLLTLQANGKLDGTKGTGIVMMDRVSATADDAAGYYIPRIILANNKFDTTKTPSANGLSITVATEEINSDNSDDYKFAAPEKR